ncbi:MAG: HAMP domain-containing histidine kinase [Chloroflexi bacterium]|nr:HAMP domain-containing histidine kinase [Chloroflexota bacterium]
MQGSQQILPLDDECKRILPVVAGCLKPHEQQLIDSWCEAYLKSAIRYPGVDECYISDIIRRLVRLFLDCVPEGRFEEYFDGIRAVGTLCLSRGLPHSNLILAMHLYEEITLPILSERFSCGPEFLEALTALDDLYHSAIALLVGVGYERSLEEQRRLQREKDEFVSTICHELRNPLTVIKGYVQMLERQLSAGDRRCQQAIDIIGRQTQKLFRLSNELLDTSRIEAGRLPIIKVKVDVREIIERAVLSLQASAEKHRMVMELPDAFPSVYCDANRVEQVLLNLLTNAIKYSPDGGEIRVTLTEDGDKAVISVRDQGIGIAAADLPNIFQRFYQPAKREIEVESTGLGLHICKGIVEAHGGKIWVESSPGEGSIFYFTVPFRG